jgi:hypothetical protein
MRRYRSKITTDPDTGIKLLWDQMVVIALDF